MLGINNNVNLNSKANVPGTISNNVVELICSLKCDTYGDFHCTQPNGDPGKDVAMGSYSPLSESAKIADFISKKTGYSKLIYDIAGQEYGGAMEDTVNLRGIPSVTCEVLTPHGTAFGLYVLAYLYLGYQWWALPLFTAGFIAAAEYLFREQKRSWESWVWLACVIMIAGCITWRSLHPNQYDSRLEVQVMQEYAIPSSLAFLALHILAVYWLLCRSGG